MLAAVPDWLWDRPEHAETRDLARLVLADAESQARASTTASAADDQLLDDLRAVIVPDRPRDIEVQMVFDPGVPAGSAQVVSDRMTSFGWRTEQPLRGWNVDRDRLYFTPESRGEERVRLVIADLAVQRVAVVSEPIVEMEAAVEIALSTAPPTWNDASPAFGWCFRDLDASREFRLVCYPSQPLCEAHHPEIVFATPAELSNDCWFDDTLRGLRDPSRHADGLGWEGVFD